MNRFTYRKRNKQKVIFVTVATILVLFLGIGYSSFSQSLFIDSMITYNFADIDVGFFSAQDFGGTIASSRSLSDDGKTMTVRCTFKNHDKQDSCIAKATIVNNSAHNINIVSDPIISYDDTYIHTVTFKWNNHPTYENHAVYKDNFIAAGSSQEVILTVKSKFIDESVNSSNLKSIPITVTLNYGVWDKGDLPTKDDLAILASSGCYLPGYDVNLINSLSFSIDDVVCPDDIKPLREFAVQVKTLTFQKGINVPQDTVLSVDLGLSQNGNVVAYALINDEYTTDTETFYDMYIQSDTQLYANEDMSFYFSCFENLAEINGLGLLDTSMMTDMKFMFGITPENSLLTSLDLNSFDTSNVTDMSFAFAGVNGSSDFTLDVSGFDTGNVVGMVGMFAVVGVNDVNFTLDVSNFDTSNVTNMNSMFVSAGYNNLNFTLDVSNFDTSKVTDMSWMFYGTGYSSTSFTLDVSNFDTSNVTDMSYMFYQMGYSNPDFTLIVSGFDTSKVTNMSCMFEQTGYNSTNFTLDVSKFDTSNVTNMSYMFYQTGYNSTNFTLDVSNFDTSNVTNMSYMFYQTGYNSTSFVTDFTIKSSGLKSYSSMFYGLATKEGSKMTVHYNSANKGKIDNIINTKSSGSNVVKGNLVFDIGEEVSISDEKFNVIDQTVDSVTLLAQKNLDSTYKQSDTDNFVVFSSSVGWEYTPGPKEIDISTWSPNVIGYLAGYASYLKTIKSDDTLTTNLITLNQLKNLGCTIKDDYSFESGMNCSSSKYIGWLSNNKTWFTRSAVSSSSTSIWYIDKSANLITGEYNIPRGVRPVVTVSKTYFS